MSALHLRCPFCVGVYVMHLCDCYVLELRRAAAESWAWTTSVFHHTFFQLWGFTHFHQPFVQLWGFTHNRFCFSSLHLFQSSSCSSSTPPAHAAPRRVYSESKRWRDTWQWPAFLQVLAPPLSWALALFASTWQAATPPSAPDGPLPGRSRLKTNV